MGTSNRRTDAIERVRMVCIWFSAPPESAVGGFSAKERGIQSARGNHLDSEIDVPDSMFVVTTSCATCGEQFYVTTLESRRTAEYTCPDCSELLLGTKAKARPGETGRPLS